MSDDRAQKITPKLLRTMPLPEYTDEVAKDTRGKLLIVAGSTSLPGAALLAARAALRIGCGTVRVAAPASVATQIGIALPELFVLPLPETDSGLDGPGTIAVLQKQFEACRAVVIGPGLDQNIQAGQVVRHVVATAPLPVLVDAQALYLWNDAYRAADGAEERQPSAGERLFTPHRGEMSTLTGRDVAAIEADRERVALEFARERRGTIVLKGAETLIASPNGALYCNTTGTRGLGTAGSGDVLAGVIGGLLAQDLDAVSAAVWGVHLHALAGEAVAKELGEDGLLASDFVERLPVALRSLRRRAPKTGSP